MHHSSSGLLVGYAADPEHWRGRGDYLAGGIVMGYTCFEHLGGQLPAHRAHLIPVGPAGCQRPGGSAAGIYPWFLRLLLAPALTHHRERRGRGGTCAAALGTVAEAGLLDHWPVRGGQPEPWPRVDARDHRTRRATGV